MAEIERLVDLRRRPGDEWVVQVMRAMFAEWRGEPVADELAAAAVALARRHDVQGGEEAWFALHDSRAVRRGSATAPELAVLRESAALSPDPRRRVVTDVHRAELLGWTGDTAGAAAALRRAVPALLHERRGFTFVALAARAAAAAAAWESSLAPALEAALAPYAGQIVVAGLVPVMGYGPVDWYRARLAEAQGRSETARRLRAAATETVERANLSGWNPTAIDLGR